MSNIDIFFVVVICYKHISFITFYPRLKLTPLSLIFCFPFLSFLPAWLRTVCSSGTCMEGIPAKSGNLTAVAATFLHRMCGGTKFSRCAKYTGNVLQYLWCRHGQQHFGIIHIGTSFSTIWVSIAALFCAYFTLPIQLEWEHGRTWTLYVPSKLGQYRTGCDCECN